MAGVKGQRSGGSNAKTAAEHKLQGTFQKVRHAGFSNPEAPKGRPTPPKKLDGDAKAEWIAMCADLEATGALAKTDRMALYQYCCLYAETEAIGEMQSATEATIELLEENLRGEDREDLLGVAQEISKLRQLEARYTSQLQSGRMKIRAYLVEFGMTPAARGRVKLPEKPPADPFDEFDTPNGVQ